MFSSVTVLLNDDDGSSPHTSDPLDVYAGPVLLLQAHERGIREVKTAVSMNRGVRDPFIQAPAHRNK